MEMQVVLLLMKLGVVLIIFLVNGSSGSLVHSSTESAPMPQTTQGPILSIPLNPEALPPHTPAPPPQTSQEHSRSVLPSTPHRRAPTIKSPITVPIFPNPAVSPISAHPPPKKRDITPVAAPPKEEFNHFPPMNHSRSPYTFASPAPHKATRPFNDAPAHFKPSPKPPARIRAHSPASSPSMSFRKRHYASKRASSPTSTPSSSFPSTSNHPGPSVSPFPSRVSYGSPTPSPVSTVPSERNKKPILSPTNDSPSRSSKRNPPPIQALPPPPPNQDCSSVTCTEPLTNTLPGSLCGCIWPMKVALRLSVALYSFFPLVSELAEELASGVSMKQSQVRIIGANAASQQLDKTIVLIDLVPLGEKFENNTAFLTFEKFWHKQVVIKSFLFGDYDILYVRYPGLPASPPLPPSSITTIDDITIDEGLHSDHGNNGRTIKPLGVDIRRKRKDGLGGISIAIIALSSAIVMSLCIGVAWLLLQKCGSHTHLPELTPQDLVPSLTKPSGAAGSTMLGTGPSSASLSFGSSITTYTGSAKTFSAGEIERATDNFDASRIIGEGGFGRVYRGILDDGTEVAVKVLKRDDHQGGREFLAEVEMLSRLHHRNLVKMIGICTEDHARCLVYELIPNGSVESHLHGVDKETAPLDWGARMKIALGAARGLAYLHEDSSPRVIHRDFKSSNILLGHDFTPKVSDFGLARTALDDGKEHTSTHVMGTFGYVAPEYAMTGLLLVKSDVYSYGVVLLELLTGRQPVDMSQPHGQENLVTFARPLLTSKEGLEMIIDPALGSNFPFDSVAKVSAIASMCVQPEVSHRPFMGEVVQALKLVCDKFDETKEVGSGEDSSILHIDAGTSIGSGSGQFQERSLAYYPMPDYESVLDAKWALSVSDIFGTSARFGRQTSGSFRRYSSSGPLRTGKSRNFWEKVRGLSRGSMSEHGFSSKSWADSH